MNTIAAEEVLIVIGLSRIATCNPYALRLAAQFMGVPPCPVCDFRKKFCRCKEAA
jgi:hypothetical protein